MKTCFRLLQTALLLSVVAAVGASATEPTITEAVALQVVDEIRADVAGLRKLGFKKEVPVRVIDDEMARKHMLARLESLNQTEHLALLGDVYRLLGLMPEGLDTQEVVLDAIEEQAGGFYDPTTGAFYLLDDMPAATVGVFTAHELTHALEDQHFDLDERLRSSLDNDDELIALSCVHEGSATLVMTVWATQAMLSGKLDAKALESVAETEAGRAEKMTALPPVLLRQLLGPYLLGAQFVARGNLIAAAMAFPAEDIDSLYRSGPTSSEQILHLEKYWSEDEKDPPVVVGLPDVAEVMGRKWKPMGQGVLGELTLGPIVGAPTPAVLNGTAGFDPSGWTNEAAAGWGGDRWQLWGRGGRRVLIWQTEWDTEHDARQFEAALPSGQGLEWKRRGSRVAVVAGEGGKRAAPLLALMLE